MSVRPVCKCHGEPMARNGLHPSGKQKYQCSIGNRARAAAWYENLSGFQANFQRLRNRRVLALRRMRKRASVG